MTYIPPWLRNKAQVAVQEPPDMLPPDLEIPPYETPQRTWEKPERPFWETFQWGARPETTAKYADRQKGESLAVYEKRKGITPTPEHALWSQEGREAQAPAFNVGDLPASIMEAAQKYSEKWGKMVTTPFRGETPYEELPWYSQLAAEMTEPIGWIAPGGKAKKGVNILDDVVKLLQKATTTETREVIAKDIFKVLTETTQAGRKFSTSEADNLINTAQKAIPTPEVKGALPSEAQKAAGGAIPPSEPPLMGTIKDFTPDERKQILTKFRDLLISPKVDKAREVTEIARRKVLNAKFNAFSDRLTQLLTEGVGAEEAQARAIKETMKGKLPFHGADLVEDITDQIRRVLFEEVQFVLKNETSELINTGKALSEFLRTGHLPNIPGIKGGSRETRLLRVFADYPEILDALKKGKPLKKVVEDLLHGVKVEGVDQELAEYLSKLSTQGEQLGLSQTPWKQLSTTPDVRTPSQKQLDLQQFQAELADLVKPKAPPVEQPNFPDITKIDAPQMFPKAQQNILIRILKQMGLGVVDIGNMLRANRASGDLSFWRQQAPLIPGHPVRFAEANLVALKALKSGKYADDLWDWITKSPLYQYYDELGKDFLRPHIKTGVPQWKLSEEFGYAGSNSAISQFTEKIPWVKLSERSFVAGTNYHNWTIFNDFYEMLLKKQARGDVVNIRQELRMMGTLLQDFTGRGSLGVAKRLGPALGVVFHAPRLQLGRLFSPRHLVSESKFVRQEAWKDLGSMVALGSSILLAGKAAGIWEVNTKPNSTDFMKARVGNTRLDIWGSYQPLVVLFARLASIPFGGKAVSTSTGEEYKIDFWNTVTRAERSKLAPLPGLIAELWTGKTFLGKKVNLLDWKQNIDRFMTFAGNDLIDAYTDNFAVGLAVTIPILLGVGSQTYKTVTPKKSEPKETKPAPRDTRYDDLKFK